VVSVSAGGGGSRRHLSCSHSHSGDVQLPAYHFQPAMAVYNNHSA
jgi:hypothetical protein